MDKNLGVFIVDDDPDHIKLLCRYLKSEAETVVHSTSSVDALPKIIEQKPDCVILDIMMPELDGLELCKLLRRERSLDAMKIVIVSGKPYQFDRERAFSFGADGYMVKPVNPKEFVDQLRQILEEKIQLTFWGVRGTLPVPGKVALKYGGNTSCVTLEFPRENLFIFDAGSGIKVFSDHIMAKQQPRIEAKLFISHPHWDHINALPFFAPLYIPGNEFEICGPFHGDTTMRELISGQMGGVYSPIKIKKFASRVFFRDLKEEEFDIHHIRIRTMLLNHPGYCLGYRLEYKSKSVCYVTDNELYPESSQFHSRAYLEKLLTFVEGTDALIIDCTYTDQEYPDRIGWGHSPVGQVVDLADRAGVRTLYLYHHDPGQSDTDIDAKLKAAQLMLKERNSTTLCVGPRENQLVKI
jgi:phosphoribosyl 1,2-cyclic phosphodiesterase/CheY-like chemotaxis protein